MKKFICVLQIFALTYSPYVLAQHQLPTVVVSAPASVAIREPVGTFSTPVSVLNYDPRVDLQERHLSEGQADLVIRGGTFEGSGVNIGAATIFDPQTGHYVTELPLSPFMLEQPKVLTGLDNTIQGFNATAGTVKYDLAEVTDNSQFRIAGGSHDFNTQQAYLAKSNIFKSNAAKINIDFDAARSELNGTRPYGQHDFERISGRLQRIDGTQQTDLIFGYQDKSFAWPNLYVLPQLHQAVGSSGVESEQLQTSLALLNHQYKYSNDNSFEVTGYYRRHKDDYEFDVKNPGLFNEFKHKTEVWSAGIAGNHNLELFNLKYTGKYIADDLNSSSLVFNDFDSRKYTKFALTPEKTWALNNTDRLILTAGSAYDHNNRSGAEFSPVAGISWDFDTQFSKDQQIYVEYAKSTKVPGYTAIASNPEAGLFRGNQQLDRENSYNLEIGHKQKDKTISTHIAGFYRRDRDLTDWIYDSNQEPFATRTAAPVDLDVYGFETFIAKNWDQITLLLGYTYLHKTDEDYGSADVDASFYALNFPKHRITAGAIYNLAQNLSLQIDNEYREQEKNILRNSKDEALFTTISANYTLPQYDQVSIFLAADNVWKTNFEDIPGVPGRGRLVSAGVLVKLD